ncbi:AbfB domain-containing protein [Actinoplanes sp. M2I2]|uniref:AbfB domain-containing protein n=1 Tax=Actinoplanes sp. M2I2 TaxID=1734444 RepID=UPI0020229198|nr:AbfB domain-containing protein [Actinoplanes sp. M2I2]
MPDEDSHDRLRIGGWVPPYRDSNGPLRAPVPPGLLGSVVRRAPGSRWPAPSARRPAGATGRRAVVALATGVLIAAAGLTTLALRDDDPGRITPAQRLVLPPDAPSDPVSVLPSPTTGSPGSVTRSSGPSRSPVLTRPTGKRLGSRPAPSSTVRPSTVRPSTAAPVLVAGATVGLERADRPGLRLRHRNFVARFDRIGDDSARPDRRDSRFTVRAALSGGPCVSLEAENFPGYFLRHRDFVLRLDRRDGSRLFEQDATFCPRPAGGGAVRLESVNYPGRFLSTGDRGVRLSRENSTAFVIREPV